MKQSDVVDVKEQEFVLVCTSRVVIMMLRILVIILITFSLSLVELKCSGPV